MIRTLALGLVALVATLLSGCGPTPPPPPTVIAAPPLAPQLAPECTTADRSWTDLADADAKRSDVARNYTINRAAYLELLARRKVCRASIKAHRVGAE